MFERPYCIDRLEKFWVSYSSSVGACAVLWSSNEYLNVISGYAEILFHVNSTGWSGWHRVALGYMDKKSLVSSLKLHYLIALDCFSHSPVTTSVANFVLMGLWDNIAFLIAPESFNEFSDPVPSLRVYAENHTTGSTFIDHNNEIRLQNRFPSAPCSLCYQTAVVSSSSTICRYVGHQAAAYNTTSST